MEAKIGIKYIKNNISCNSFKVIKKTSNFRHTKGQFWKTMAKLNRKAFLENKRTLLGIKEHFWQVEGHIAVVYQGSFWSQYTGMGT